jgi:hypothetical protein
MDSPTVAPGMTRSQSSVSPEVRRQLLALSPSEKGSLIDELTKNDRSPDSPKESMQAPWKSPMAQYMPPVRSDDNSQIMQVASLMRKDTKTKQQLKIIKKLEYATNISDVALFLHDCGNQRSRSDGSYAACFDSLLAKCSANSIRQMCQSQESQESKTDWTSFVDLVFCTLYDSDYLHTLADKWKDMAMLSTETVSHYEERTSKHLYAAIQIAKWTDQDPKTMEKRFSRAWITGLPKDIRVSLMSSVDATTPFATVHKRARAIATVSAETGGESKAENQLLKRKIEQLEQARGRVRDSHPNRGRDNHPNRGRDNHPNRGRDNHHTGETKEARDARESKREIAIIAHIDGKMEDLANVVCAVQDRHTQQPDEANGSGRCYAFAKGSCRNGESCRYTHGAPKPFVAPRSKFTDGPPPPLGPPPPGPPLRQLLPIECRDFTKGSCRRGRECRYLHHPKA